MTIRRQLALTLVLFGGSILSATAWTQERLYLSDPGCPVLSRKKFTRSWSPFSSGLDAGTEVKVLGRSGKGGRAAFIFDVIRPMASKYKQTEFKAPQSCFGDSSTAAEGSSGPSLPTEGPGPSRGRARWFRTQLSYFNEELSFVDTASGNPDRVIATHYSLGLGLGFEKAQRWRRYGITALATVARVSAVAPTPLFNTFEGTALSFGLSAEPYYLYPLSRKFYLGLGSTLAAHYTTWAEATTGTISKKITYLVSAQVKSTYLWGRSEVGLDLGLGLIHKALVVGLRYGRLY